MQMDGRAQNHGPNPVLRPIGRVASSLRDFAACPHQEQDGPEARVILEEAYVEGLEGLEAGDTILLLTWLDRGNREILRVHPKGNPQNPERGVFSTRSPSRPNPIGLHRVRILGREGRSLLVSHLEVLDGTPVLDIKPEIPTAVPGE